MNADSEHSDGCRVVTTFLYLVFWRKVTFLTVKRVHMSRNDDLPTTSCGMTKIVNLRLARKRAARERAARDAAEKRLAYGVSKVERNRVAADRASTGRILDQHRIETGDRS